jgi:hypothetical protein
MSAEQVELISVQLDGAKFKLKGIPDADAYTKNEQENVIQDLERQLQKELEK